VGGLSFYAMSTLQEIEQAVEVLPTTEQEALIRFLTARLELKASPGRPYRTKTHPGNVRPGIDPDKLGQLAEDF
jgi:hypothetical protein